MIHRISIYSLSILVLLAPAAARAAVDVRGESAITAVTVFPGRAEIVRTVEVSLPAGQSTVVIDGLPASLIPQSIRVRGTADGALLIGSVESKPHFTEGVVREEERALRAELVSLRDRRRGLDDRIAAARIQLKFIEAIGRDGPRIIDEKIAQGRFDPEAWQKALGLIGTGSAGAFEQIHKAEIEKRELHKKIAQTERRLNQVRTGRTATVTARINVATQRPAKARLEVSYQLPGASWRPLYDARLNSTTGETRLVQIGEVRQHTGEDWSNVALTLSTARPAASARLPELQPWFVDFVQPLGLFSMRGKAESEVSVLRSMQKSQDALQSSRERMAEPSGVAGFLVAAKPVTAQVVAGEFAAQYRIPGAANVPSDKAPHKFVIAERTFEAKLAVRTVPKIAPQAYLYGEITYEGDAPLLPGPVSVFRDEAFIGTSAVPMLRPGEDFKLSFGVDDKVRVSYRLETGQRSREGIFNNNRRMERRYLIKVANHHKRAMEITVLDQLPVPQDEDIEVELLRTSTKVSERDVEDRKGVLAWRGTYKPGEERIIKFGYAVTYPVDHMVPGF